MVRDRNARPGDRLHDAPRPLPFPQPKAGAVDGLPFGRVAVSASRTVTIGAAVGEWGAVAWPAQQAAGDLLGLLQLTLELCATLAASGWAGAIAPRGRIIPPCGYKPC